MEYRSIEFSAESVGAALRSLPLGGLRVFQSVGSTNDEAMAWAAAGAPDLSLVVADSQTAGRGRSGRAWLTPPGCALALSFVVREAAFMGRLAGLGALAVTDACAKLGLVATIKWPNDVLLMNQKTAGVLVEAHWSGNALDSAIIGIGINVLTAAAPPSAAVRYPATSIEACLGETPDRIEVLRLVVSAFAQRRAYMGSDDFMQDWAAKVAFQGQAVILSGEGMDPVRGVLDGLEEDGSLRLLTGQGVERFPIGELHLAADDTIR